MKHIKKAVIAVAGKGTRMAPITRAIPKEMLPLGTTPILEYIVKEVVESGIKEILFILSQDKKVISQYFSAVNEPNDYNLSSKTYPMIDFDGVSCAYCFQNNATGTATAVMLAKSFVGEDDFALLYGDDVIISDVPCTRQLILGAENAQCVVGVQRLDSTLASLYATTECSEVNNRVGRLLHIHEKQAPDTIKSRYTSMGRYLFTPKIFDYINKIDARNNEYWITDAIELLAQEEIVNIYDFEGTRYDTGNPEAYIHAFKMLNK